MTSFIILATLISVVVVALLVWSSLRSQGVSRNNEARSHCYRAHEQTLQELAADHAAGLIDELAYREARFEAESRLVEDIRNIDERPIVDPMYRWLVPVAFALPLAAAGLYLLVGNLAATDPESAFVRTGNVGQFVNAVEQLEEKIRRNPDDLHSQLMLARSYRAMGRYEDSVAAFGKAWPVIKDNPTELTVFAGVLAIYRGNFEGKPDELIQQALVIDPTNHDALTLAGGSAYQKGNYAGALRHWQKLHALLDAGSEEQQWVAGQIADAQRKLENPDDDTTAARPDGLPQGHPVNPMGPLSPMSAAPVR